MNLEGNDWADDVQVWLVKKTHTNHLFFLLLPLLGTFSLHALPPLVPRRELLGMGTSLWFLATAVVGSAWDVPAQNSCSCTPLLVLSYFC